MPFLAERGVLALGSRFKSLSDQLYEAVDRVYQAQGAALQARWFPVLAMLAERGPLAVGDVARELGQSHSAISQLTNKLIVAGLVRARSDRDDRRRRVLALSDRGQAEVRALRPVWRAVVDVVSERMEQAGAGLLDALARFENNLLESPIDVDIVARVQAAARRRLRIVPWDAALREHFYRLNVEWLQRYFYVEQIDHEVLSNPEQRIIEPGGTILFAQLDDEVVGTCALLHESPGVYELTKMAVTEHHQGLGIGRRLLVEAIAEFRRRGGHELFLESSTKLQNALRLYAGLGFQMQAGRRPGTHYSRADVYMIWRDPLAADA